MSQARSSAPAPSSVTANDCAGAASAVARASSSGRRSRRSSRLGARPWAERARIELRATGEHLRRRDPTTAERLTPQELQITLLVAEGLTNRDVGARLFLSPKTVEFHLTRIYRKLEIHSRSELVRRRVAEADMETDWKPQTAIGGKSSWRDLT